MRALIGLDPSDFEKDAIESEPSEAPAQSGEPASRGETQPESLASSESLVTSVGEYAQSNVVRTGT